MPTTIAQTSTYNVETSLNAWLRTQLTAVTRPAWFPALPGIITDTPEKAPSLPAFSIFHIPVDSRGDWQGRIVSSAGGKGLWNRGIMEVDAWVTRANKNWLAQLRTMEDMVMTVLANTTEVAISDYAANQSSPSTTSYLVRLRDTRAVATAPDPNPDIERRRMLVTYEWVYRS